MVQGHVSSLDNWQYTLNKNNSQRKGNCITNFLNADRPTHEIQWPIIPKETTFRKLEGCTGAPFFGHIAQKKATAPKQPCEIYHNSLKCSLLSMLKDVLTTESHCFQTLNIPTLRMGDGWLNFPTHWGQALEIGMGRISSWMKRTSWRVLEALVVMLEAPTY